MKRISILIKEDATLLIKISFCLMVLIVFYSALKRKFDRDELEAVHTAWKMLNGEQIYLDFFQHHHPFLYYFISPVVSLVGECVSTLIVLRSLMFSFFLAILYISFSLAHLTFKDRRVSWLATLLLISMAMFTQKAIEIRPDVLEVFFGLLAIWTLFLFRKTKTSWQFCCSFICLGVSFLFLQKAIVIVTGIGLLQLYWWYDKKMPIIALCIYWTGFLLVISPYYLFLFFTNQLEVYLFFNWILNAYFEDKFSALHTIWESFWYNHFIWIFYLPGIYIGYIKGRRAFVFISVLMLGSVFLVQAPYRQYFLPFIPFMAALSALAMTSYLNQTWRAWVVSLVVLTAMIVYVREVIVYDNSSQLEKISWVLENTTAEDYVYDGDIYFNVFRKDIDFFWFSTESNKGGLETYRKLKPYTYDVYASIDKYKPKLISDLFIDNLDHPSIKNHYVESKAYKGMYVWIGPSLPD